MPDPNSILVLAAHPDDLEFGCGPILAQQAAAGRKIHALIVTRGEAASRGTPLQRARETQAAAKILGITAQFFPLSPDAQLKPRTEHALKLAGEIRRHQPAILLAPTLVKNQHPDHAALGSLAQMAARLARYGGLKHPALRKRTAHAIDLLLFYAITHDAEPKDIHPILIDVSAPGLIAQWTRAMHAHASQTAGENARKYLELQLTRARLHGLRAGVQHALPLYPNDPLLFSSLGSLTRSARTF